MEGKEGSKVSFDKVLLLDDGKVTIGAPVIENAEVSAKILGHLKGDKVIVFKKKRRKGYKVKNGHRQFLTEIQIDGISTKKAPAKKAEAKKETTAKKEAPAKKETAAKKPAAKKATPKKEAKAETKPAAKKAAPKKPAAKKPAAKKAAEAKKESPEK